jgi:hypothetical protein
MNRLTRLFLIANGFLCAFTCNALSADGWPNGVIGTSSGRYVLGQLNQLARDQYLLDTQTGQLWRLSTYEKDGSSVALFPVPYVPIEKTSSFENFSDFKYLPAPVASDSSKNTKKK